MMQVEIISGLPADATISLYRCGPMVDLCTGPHLPNTGYLKAVAVNAMSRAFWRADVNREPLQVRDSGLLPTGMAGHGIVLHHEESRHAMFSGAMLVKGKTDGQPTRFPEQAKILEASAILAYMRTHGTKPGEKHIRAAYLL